MTEDIKLLTEFGPCYENWTIKIVDGSLSRVVGTGSITLSKEHTLNSILLVPNLDCNLLSISKLTNDHNYLAKFSNNLCEFPDLDLGRIIGNTEAYSRLYLLKKDDIQSRQVHPNRCFTS